MKTLLSIGIGILTSLSLYGTEPNKIDFHKQNRGPQGYDIVRQKWIGDDHGKVVCLDYGELKCSWTDDPGGSHGYPIDLEAYATMILQEHENYGNASGTMIVGEVVFHFWVLENLGDGDGGVRFHFIAGL